MIQSPGLVSVVTPCHNAASFVGETLDSVLAQTQPEVEHIVVDDGSSDGSWEVIEAYARAHPERVRGIRLERNRGGSHARNVGARQARGGYVMFLDADDLIEPETLAALVEAVRNRPGTLGVCEWGRLVQREGAWVEQPREVAFPSLSADPLKEWLEGRWVPTCSVLWRREVYDGTGGWDETLTGDDDGELMRRALLEGTRLVAAPNGRSHYRSHGESRLSLSGRLLVDAGVFGSFMRSLETLEGELERRGRRDEYLTSLGAAYARLPAAGFLQTHPELAWTCTERARLYSGEGTAARTHLGRTPAGRLLSRLLGVIGKERVAAALARVGIMTSERRRFLEMSARHAGRAASPKPPSPPPA